MASDKLFHKRKEKTASDLKRRNALREAYDRVLIVCEGSKTEPMYFQALRDYFKLGTANIRITGESDSSPDKIVSFAKAEFDKEKKSGNKYDRVYCVFDRDSHSTYSSAMGYVNRSLSQLGFHTSVSDPCFEFWLLLHFRYTDQRFNSVGSTSICDAVIKCLKKHILDYSKGRQNDFLGMIGMIGMIDDAITNSKRAINEAARSGRNSPITTVHELVEYLKNIK